jgi:hypothetical protein
MDCCEKCYDEVMLKIEELMKWQFEGNFIKYAYRI